MFVGNVDMGDHIGLRRANSRCLSLQERDIIDLLGDLFLEIESDYITPISRYSMFEVLCWLCPTICVTEPVKGILSPTKIFEGLLSWAMIFWFKTMVLPPSAWMAETSDPKERKDLPLWKMMSPMTPKSKPLPMGNWSSPVGALPPEIPCMVSAKGAVPPVRGKPPAPMPRLFPTFPPPAHCRPNSNARLTSVSMTNISIKTCFKAVSKDSISFFTPWMDSSSPEKRRELVARTN